MRKEAVAVILYNRETGMILTEVRTREDRTYYQQRIFPGGLVEENEDESVTGIREIKEELNILITNITKLKSEDEIVGDYGEIIHPYFADEWEGETPQLNQDGKNLLVWEDIDQALLSEPIFKQLILQLVVKHLAEMSLVNETEVVEQQPEKF